MTAPRHGGARFTWSSSAATATGNVRKHNEDAVLARPDAGLWVVADGMGGHHAGDVASGAIVSALSNVSRHSRPSALLDEVEDRLYEVNHRLYSLSRANGSGTSGSTVAVLVALEWHVLSIWAGDSRIYRRRNRELAQITRDHSETQEMLDGGVISVESATRRESSNVITRAVGGASELFLDIELTELHDRDSYLLCTDGLYRELPDPVLLRELGRKNPQRTCASLLQRALTGPCKDNISAVVVRFAAS
jgi:serine/threonine protein phosphatase PrpC